MSRANDGQTGVLLTDQAVQLIIGPQMSRIREIRERLGLTQQQLADGIGCTQGNVGHYEKGQVLPTTRALVLKDFAASKGLALSMDQVLGLEPLPEAEET